MKKGKGAPNEPSAGDTSLKPYRTLAAAGSGSYTEKKSVFLGEGARVASEEAARAFLEDVRAKHRDASHVCYAYILGQDGNLQRFSDAGEPQGTAGVPILETLKSRGVVDACVAVTRWFGGTLLGAGGLARAYAKAASLAVSACGVCDMVPTRAYALAVPFPYWEKLRHRLRTEPCRLENVQYTEGVSCTVLVRASDADALLARVADATDGRAHTAFLNEQYDAWETAETPSNQTDG